MTALAQPAGPSAPSVASAHDKILIVDFGSQVTQLIARRVREEGVYSEIVPFQKADAAFRDMQPKAVILSGGPESVHEAGSPRAPQAIFDSGVPVLGICYGQMTMAAQLGGDVEGGHHREFGRADVEVKAASQLFDTTWNLGERHPVWMSHGDRITKMPPGFEVAGTSANAPFAIIQDEKRRYYGLMFHPEVVHPRRRQAAAQFRPQGRGPHRRLDHARVPRGGDREDPRGGRPGQGDLRPVRRG
jgi:GMP synthase (glutamine-hydrolysing)